MSQIIVAALYQFTEITDLEQKQAELLDRCRTLHLKGTLILAEEGINGTIAGSREAIDTIIDELKLLLGTNQLEYKESLAHEQPFYRMKIKIKPEIVTMGIEAVNPNVCVGEYVEPEDWNAIISDPNTIVIDTRNDYEVKIGTFKGAINPETDSFRAFPQYTKAQLHPNKNKKVAMFCTGGIRCEKASAYMINQGFETVYHLKGGILKYLEKIPEKDSLWLGECFVFDNRVAVKHGLKQGSYDLCHGCRMPINDEHKESHEYIPGVACPYCAKRLSDDQKERFAERQKQMQLAKERNQQHLGSKD